MAQISYGSITIIDTNDIERIYPVYCKGGETNAPSLQPLINWSENVSQAGGDGDYIWQRIVAKKQGIAVTAEDYSDAVRLTGDDGASLTITSIQYAQTQNENDTPSYGNSMPSPINEGWWLWVKTTYSDSNSVVTKIKQGQKGDTGISVTGTKEIYFLKRTTDNTPTAPADGVATTSTSTAGGIWTTVVPNYIEGGIYYTSIQTTYSSGTSPKSSTAVINQGLTDANAKALAAYNTSTARDTEINALQAQAKYFWWDSEGAHVASGESGGNIEYETPTTYKFNALMAPGSFKLRYNNKNFAQLTTGSLTFFRPAYINGQYEQGKKAMELNSDALTFYKPLAYNSANEPTAAATLNANGLVLSEGGIKAGDPNQSGFIYLSTEDYPLREFILTEDQTIDNTKTYYQFDSNSQTYLEVEEPDVSEINTYYELTEAGISINNYTPTKGDNNLDTISNPAWRQVIGTKFGVDSAGNLYASGANISGGEIGRFTIANDLYSGQLGEEDSVWVSTGTQQTAQIGGVTTLINNWAFTAGNKFGVTADGDLYASNATISGTLTITNKNSNILTKEEAEALANMTQNMTQESIEDILKVVDMTNWIAKYGDCEPTSDTEAIKGKLYFDANKQQVIPTVNPHLQNYYELNNSTWTISEDTIVDINKQYFEQNGESNYYYTPIKPVGNENPYEEQWYELSNETYQLSSDNDLVNNKLYFLQITDGTDIYYQVITEYIPNPYALGLYELNSINKSISSYINTHVKLDNGAIIIQADNTEASISISLNDGILLKDDNGIPIASFSDTIVLGNRSEMHLELSPGDSSNNILPELGFYDGYTKVAYVNSDTLNINQGEIKEKLRIGQFEWRTQGTNRISLIYAPT